MIDHRLSLSLCLVASYAAVKAQIDLGALPSNVWCAGTTMDIPFTASGAFDPGNTFVLEISDANGLFAPAVPIGSLSGTTSGTITAVMIGLAPGTGYLLRIRSTDPVMTSPPSSSTLELAAPNAGANATITVCSSDPPFPMYQELGGTPQLSGTWTGPDGQQSSGTFDPAVDRPGVYFYSVPATMPCVNSATANLTVTVNAAADAGTSGTVTFCPTDAPFLLMPHLGGSPFSGGTWASSGAPHAPFFTPGTDVPGAYIYIVAGTSPCANATATVMVSQGTCATSPGPQYLRAAPGLVPPLRTE